MHKKKMGIFHNQRDNYKSIKKTSKTQWKLDKRYEEFTQEINGSWKYDKILSFTIVRIQIKDYTKNQLSQPKI